MGKVNRYEAIAIIKRPFIDWLKSLPDPKGIQAKILIMGDVYPKA